MWETVGEIECDIYRYIIMLYTHTHTYTPWTDTAGALQAEAGCL